jgi:hypothetical protein
MPTAGLDAACGLRRTVDIGLEPAAATILAGGRARRILHGGRIGVGNHLRLIPTQSNSGSRKRLNLLENITYPRRRIGNQSSKSIHDGEPDLLLP